MSERLVTLEEWAKARYGNHPPFIGTLRRWVREGKIYPHPEKQGRSYYVAENARYVADYNNSNFLEAVRGSTSAQQS